MQRHGLWRIRAAEGFPRRPTEAAAGEPPSRMAWATAPRPSTSPRLRAGGASSATATARGPTRQVRTASTSTKAARAAMADRRGSRSAEPHRLATGGEPAADGPHELRPDVAEDVMPACGAKHLGLRALLQQGGQ